jgi:hypothetical protein
MSSTGGLATSPEGENVASYFLSFHQKKIIAPYFLSFHQKKRRTTRYISCHLTRSKEEQCVIFPVTSLEEKKNNALYFLSLH